MARNLSLFVFDSASNLADSSIGNPLGGWQLAYGDIIYAMSGDDVIITPDNENAVFGYRDPLTGISALAARSTNRYGLNNYGFIAADNGNDSIIGFGTESGIRNSGNISTDSGADVVSGSGGKNSAGTGIVNYYGKIDTGSENDEIIGIGSSFLSLSSPGSGIINEYGSVETGDGDDRIVGIGGEETRPDSNSSDGIRNLGSGSIALGGGDDSVSGSGSGAGIRNEGVINTDSGNDTITGTGSESGIRNEGAINMGSGDDRVTGISTDQGFAIANSGVINTGAGNDIVDVVSGGIINGGDIILGSGKDVFRGFGSNSVDGGAGRDKVILGAGKYEIIQGKADNIRKVGGGTMIVESIEKIGGISGGIFAFREGVLTVSSEGVARFSA